MGSEFTSPKSFKIFNFQKNTIDIIGVVGDSSFFSTKVSMKDKTKCMKLLTDQIGLINFISIFA